MERNNSQWIKELKIAVINNDIEKIGEYSKRKLPKFKNIEELQEALLWIKKATNILKKEKEKLAKELHIFKQSQKYNNIYLNNSTNNWKC